MDMMTDYNIDFAIKYLFYIMVIQYMPCFPTNICLELNNQHYPILGGKLQNWIHFSLA